MVFRYQDLVNKHKAKKHIKYASKKESIDFEKVARLIKRLKREQPYNLYSILEKYANSGQFRDIDNRVANILSVLFLPSRLRKYAMDMAGQGKPTTNPDPGKPPGKPVGPPAAPAGAPSGDQDKDKSRFDLYKSLTIAGPILAGVGLIGIMSSNNKTLWGIVFLLGAAALAAGVTRGFSDFGNIWNNFTGPWVDVWSWIKGWFAGPGGNPAPAQPAKP